MSGSSEPGPAPARRRWRLADLIGLVIFVAIGLGTYRAVEPEPWLGNAFRFGIFLLAMAVALVLSFAAPGRWRPFWRGWSASAVLHLACILRFGFYAQTLSEAAACAKAALLGLPLGLMAGMAAQLFADRGGAA